MASHDFFQAQAKRLINVYGKNKYPSERLELIWEAIKFTSNDDLKFIIDNFIADSVNAPMRENFSNIIRDRRVEQHRQDNKKAANLFIGRKLTADEISKGIGAILKNLGSIEGNTKLNNWAALSKAKQLSCKFCDDTGLISAKEKNSKYDGFTFKCICMNGRNIQENFPQWDSIIAKDYEINL